MHARTPENRAPENLAPHNRAPHNRTPELVIFDCDGVLVDSERIANREFADLLREIGLDYTLPQMFETFVGNSMPRCVEIITARLGHAPPADLLDRYSARVATVLPRQLRAVAGVTELLDRLDGAAVPYCVASNGEHALMRVKLTTAGLIERFDARRFSAADVPRPKPAPDLFLHAAAAMGADPRRCVVIEDSPLGVQGARAAGMTVFGYADVMPEATLYSAGATAVVHRLLDVLPLLDLPEPLAHGLAERTPTGCDIPVVE